MLPVPPDGHPICIAGLDLDRWMERTFFINQLESIWQKWFTYIAVILSSKSVCISISTRVCTYVCTYTGVGKSTFTVVIQINNIRINCVSRTHS